jgi:hypothetical protein
MIARVVKNVDTFDPMKDALLNSAKEMKVRFTEDIENIEIGNETWNFKKDEIKELKENIAIFFLLKGSAIVSQ